MIIAASYINFVLHVNFLFSFCKGRTLYSVVRDTKNTLDINKTRQIAQEIVKVSSVIRLCCLLSLAASSCIILVYIISWLFPAFLFIRVVSHSIREWDTCMQRASFTRT